MFSLSQTAGYAVLALSCLEKNGKEFVQETTIAEMTGISKPYLSKLIHRLGQSNLIVTKRGNKGGIALAKPANEISILDISDAIDGEEWKERCCVGLPNCSGEHPCPLHEFWLEERPRIIAMLDNMKLDEVITFRERGWKLEIPLSHQ